MTSPSQPIWILPLASDQAVLPLVGGKGANLALLARAGLPVPDGFLIATPAYEAFLTANDLTARIVNALPEGAPDSPDQVEKASTLIRSLFGQASISAGLAAQILTAYARLGRPAVAVRSSATAEDLPDMSFAGQQDTYLNVVGDEALLAAVVDCWSSLWTARAISYRARNRVPYTGVALAVVVQKMVESQASGVLFTANPLTGLRTETVIDATVGLGEALVAGQIEPDHYVVDTRSGQISGRTLGAKAMSIRSQPGGGTAAVYEDQATAQALPDAQIQALAALGRRVAELYGAPQDIEWAWANDTLYLLQARPITSLFPTPTDLAPTPLMVMFSFGAVQGMLDPVTPLGRDILREVMVAIGPLFGIPTTQGAQRVLFTAGERLWANVTPVLRNAIGRRIAQGAMQFVDPAAGEAIAAIWHEAALQPGRRRISPHAAAQVARFLIPVAGNVLLNLLSPDRRRRVIVAHGERVLAAVQARAAAVQGNPRVRLAQWARLVPQSLEEFVPRTFRVFLSGIASGMASYNMLRVLSKRLPAAPASGSNDSGERILQVTRGLPHNPTTEMDLALWQVAQTIQADAAARRAFADQPPTELAARYLAGTLPGAAQRAFGQFLARYGARGLAEIDLGRPRWAEEPAHLMEVVAGYLQITDKNQAPDAVFARGAAAAQAIVDQMAATARQGPHGWLKARLIRLAAGRTRTLMALRESPKFFVVRLLGVFRHELLTIGQELAAAGELHQPDDLVYLSLSELAAFGDGKPGDWASLISQRRTAFQREQMRRQIPHLLLSDGRAFYAGVTGRGEVAGALTGSPVSPGSVEGRVRVVLDPRSAGLVMGEILVCRGTDPSWTPLFLTAAGLIMEVGGMMTHGAVVAREYGIPAVVGVDRATERLATGQRIALNGSSGEIRLLDEKVNPG
jgi:pyruvate,water dikinase